MRAPDLPALVHDRVLDAPTTALLWLLLEGGLPLVAAGPADAAQRATLARSLLSAEPLVDRPLLDAETGAVTIERVAGLLRGGSTFGVTVTGAGLEAVIERLESTGLPPDGVRRLGAVLIVGTAGGGLRVTSVHYLRPAERDAQGHLQRRPPAVLMAWDAQEDAFEDYAWGISPELADRVGRSQADLEERRAGRARLLDDLAAAGRPESWTERITAHLRQEPTPALAPVRPAVRPSPFHGGLLDPDHNHGR